jgi:AraC-like DNA-binding protein
MTIYAPLLGTFWRTVESYDLDPRDVIPERFFRPGKKFRFSDRISFEDWDRIHANVAALVKDPAMGIRAGQHTHPSHLGALGFAWLSSSTLRTGLRRGQRFARMFNEYIEVHLDEQPGSIRTSYRLRVQPTRPRLVGDGQVAGLLTMCRANFGESLQPLEVTLKRHRPADPSPWHDFFGPNILFGQDDNSIALSDDDADRKLTSANAEMARLHEDVIHRYLLRLDRDNILNRTRLQIMEQLPSGRVTESGTARALNISKSTLKRRLRENEQTFRSILNQVRADLAERYLKSQDYSVTEIAFLLGYNDASAFSRAFKSWFGHTPSQARARMAPI